MSFNPFITGKRACIGKTFAEILIKSIIAMVTWRYDIEFVNKSYYEKMPTVDITLENS